MTPKERKDLETLLDLFLHPGWKLFMEDMERRAQGVWVRVPTLKTLEDLHRFQGERSILDVVRSYEAITRETLERVDVDSV